MSWSVIWSVIWSTIKALFNYRGAMDQLRHAAAHQAANQAVVTAFQAGEYARALAASEGLKQNGQETAAYCFYQGSLRRSMGDPVAAEQWLRKAIPLQQDPQLAALATEALGEALLDQDRYDDARKAFESSLSLCAVRSSSDRCLAETWLRQGEQLNVALAHARTAVAKQQARDDDPAAPYNLAENLAVLAWAVASAEPDAFRVTSLAKEASELMPAEVSVPTAAQVRVHLGCAYAALGNSDESRNCFEEAARMDPRGHWGVSARKLADAVGAGQ